MKGELYINGQDAWTTWGIGMDSGSLGTLMAPPSLKEFVSNESRLEDGRQYIVTNAKMKERELTLRLHLHAPTAAVFYQRLNAFCKDVLAQGTVDISTCYQPDVVYHCIYLSCSQYTQFRGKVAKLALKLVEPKPLNIEH